MNTFNPFLEVLHLVIQLSITVGLVVAVFVVIYAILLPFLGKKKPKHAMLSAYHKLCTTYPSHNEEKRKAYLARARECRAQAMAARYFRQKLESLARGAERRRESREFRAQHLANIALSHHVPNTKLGRRLLILFHPLLTTDGQLVWRELWTRGAYRGTPFAALSIAHSPWI